MTVGFVAESRNRKAVFIELGAGEKDPARIAKKHHLIPRAVDSALQELEGAGLVKKAKDGFGLTPEGERVLHELRRGEKPA